MCAPESRSCVPSRSGSVDSLIVGAGREGPLSNIFLKGHTRLHVVDNMLPPVANLGNLPEVITQPSSATQIVETKPSSHRLVSLELVIHKETNLPTGRQFVLVEQGSGSPFQLSLEELVLIG